MKLKTLRPRVQQLQARIVQPAATQRVRGSNLQVIRHRILSRDHGICRCIECKRMRALNLAAEVEHLVPLWAGGAEDDSNRYAIATTCHALKTACEAAMRARCGYDPSMCTCGRHPKP